MKVLRVLLIVFALSYPAFGQDVSSIRGTVTFALKPAANVEITVTSRLDPSFVIRTVTDANGIYLFENIRPGKYLIRAQNNSALQAAGEIELSGGQNTLDLRLLPANPINESVTISADNLQTFEEVSKTVDIIGGQELRQRADFTLVDSLRSIPGFRVQQLGGFGRTANIKSRGLRNQDTAILIDGIRFRDPSSITGDASAFLSDFTLTSVERIEVLRGSGSSLYGTNAIGGTVDFKTPQPRAGFHGQLSGAVGGLGLGRFRGNFSDGTADESLGFNLGVSRTVYTKGIDGEDNAHNTNFQGRIDYRPFKNTDLSARIFVSDAYVRLNSEPDTASTLPISNSTIIRAEPGVTFLPDLNDSDSLQRSQFFNGQFVATHVFGNRLIGQAFYSGVRTNRKNDNGILGPGFQSSFTSVFNGAINTINGHLNWLPNKFHSITAGYEFEAERFGNDGFIPDGTGNFATRAGQSSHAIYFQDLVGLFGDRLQLAVSARTQFFDLKRPTFSSSNAPFSRTTAESPASAYTFDAAASYYFQSSGTKLRSHVGNGYRIPSLFERFGTIFNTFAFPGPRFEALGDPFLRSERSIAADVGLEQTVWKQRLRLSAVYFYTKLINTIGFSSTVPNVDDTPRPFGGYLNTKGGIARGAELSGRFRPSAYFELFTSYTLTDSDQNSPQVAGSQNYESLGIPHHQFTVVAMQRFGRFWINADFLGTSSYLGSIFDTNNFTFRPYIYRFKGNRRLDVTAGHTFAISKDKFLRLFATLENVLDYDYYENGFQTPGRNGRIGLSFAF